MLSINDFHYGCTCLKNDYGTILYNLITTCFDFQTPAKRKVLNQRMQNAKQNIKPKDHERIIGG